MALLDGLSEAFRRLDCAVLGSSAYILGGLRSIAGSGQGGLESGINGLRRLRGCDPANDVAPPPPPFTGGQCLGVPYSYTYVVTTGSGGAGPPQNVTCGAGQRGPISLRREPNGPGGVRIFLSSNRANGTRQETLLVSSTGQASVAISNMTRCDGQADVCGNPPPDYPPPIDLDIDVDVTFLDEGDNIVNVTIPVTFKPLTVNFNGDVKFPFEFNLGGIDFNGDVQFAPRFALNVNPPRLPPTGVNPPPSGSEPSTPAPIAPRGSKVQGVIVVATLDADSEVSSYEGSPVPDIYVPRLGSVKFAYSFGVATVWSNDIDVKGTSVFIPCPFSQGADAVQGRPQPGVTFSLSAVTGPPLATVDDLT